MIAGSRGLGRIGWAALLLVLGDGVGRAEDFPAWATKWRDAGLPALFAGAGDGAWDRKIRERGWIEHDGITWHLWYTGYNEDLSKRRMLGHASSADGVHWTRDPGNPLHDESWVEDMCVVRDGPILRMFAEGEGDRAHQLTSEDGSTWVDRGTLDVRRVDGSPIEPGPFGTPTVWVEDGRWWLFYERGDLGVWLARSDDPDRMVWTNVRDDPVIAMGPAAYDRAAVALNQVVQSDGWYYAFYHANERRGPWGEWTTCVARSRDLIAWEKYPGNPIVRGDRSSGQVIDPDGPTGPEPARLYTTHPDVRLHLPAAPAPAKSMPGPAR
jgi:hypothetical protein